MGKTIAIVPARGGSVRLPRKNVLEFCGIPLIAWSIIQAKCSKLIDDVYVITDDSEIAEISKRYGANVFMQPQWMSKCKPHAAMAVTYALKEIMKNNDIEIVVPILCTNPLIKPDDLDNGITLLKKLQVSSIKPLQPIRELTLVKKINDNFGKIEIFSKDYEFLREGGNWSVFYASVYLEMSKNNEGENWDESNISFDEIKDMYYYPVEIWQYADTDTLEEFQLAEILMWHYILKGTDSMVYMNYANDNNTKQGNLFNQYIGNTNQISKEE